MDKKLASKVSGLCKLIWVDKYVIREHIDGACHTSTDLSNQEQS